MRRSLTTLRVSVIPVMVASAGATSDCRGRTSEVDAQALRQCDSVAVFEDIEVVRFDGRAGHGLPGLTDVHVYLYDASGLASYLTGQARSSNP